jgi:hypothetical protein
MNYNNPALMLRTYSFWSKVSKQEFYSEIFQENLYQRLDSEYKEIIEKDPRVNHDICYIAGGLISYGRIDLIREFICNHPLYIQDPKSPHKKSPRDIYGILLDSIIFLFPVPIEILKNDKAEKIKEFEYWINNNLLNLEWDQEKGQYLFKQSSPL